MKENKKEKILIVDDNPKNLQVLGKILKNENYQIEFAMDGETALSWIQKTGFDLILLDIMMPGISGLEACKKIRESNDYKETPVIFLSANYSKETILEGFDCGGQDYVTKPFDSRELLARIRTQIELKNSREKLKDVNKWLDTQVKSRTKDLLIANEKLDKLNRELLSLDEIKIEFLNIISHEIRTPLNGILGSMGLLKQKAQTEEWANLIRILDVSVSRLEKFSYTGLIITELKAGKKEIEKKKIDLIEIIRSAAFKQWENCSEKKINFNLTGEERGFILGNEDLLSSCLESIINNAYNYSPENAIVNCSTQKKGNQIICKISDQGKGFSDKTLKNQFKLFQPGEKHVNENIGIELTMAKLIMDEHDGTIEIFNNDNRGAIVQLTFNSWN